MQSLDAAAGGACRDAGTHEVTDRQAKGVPGLV